jgi:lipoyl(octanoyl) transferase
MASVSPRLPITDAASQLQVRDLGRMKYLDAFALQKELQSQVIADRDAASDTAGVLLLVEHDPPVITVSRRPGARLHLLASESQLLAAGVEVAETDRGGDITYHGPGQLVVYPILDLNRLGLRLISYLRFLEQIIIDVLARFDIEGTRDACATGVWVPQRAGPSPARTDVANCTNSSAKIAAIGVRVSRWVSMHGLALNVTTKLDHFNLIVPCGLTGRNVTSMKQILGESCPSMDEVKRIMVEEFQSAVERASAG